MFDKQIQRTKSNGCNDEWKTLNLTDGEKINANYPLRVSHPCVIGGHAINEITQSDDNYFFPLDISQFVGAIRHVNMKDAGHFRGHFDASTQPASQPVN